MNKNLLHSLICGSFLGENNECPSSITPMFAGFPGY